jgi:hypothetical protein
MKSPASYWIVTDAQMIDGIEKMKRAIPEDNEDRLVQLNFELCAATYTLLALKEPKCALAFMLCPY